MKPRDVTITTVLNGWIVKVGCQHLVFTSLDMMLKDLTAYLENPEATEATYQANAVNAEFFNFLEPVAQEREGYGSLNGIGQRLEETRARVNDSTL